MDKRFGLFLFVLIYTNLTLSCEKPVPDEHNKGIEREDATGSSEIAQKDSVVSENLSYCIPRERICSLDDVLMCKMDGSDFVYLKNCLSGCENGDCVSDAEKQDPVLYDDLDFWPAEYSSSGLTWNHSPITYCFENFTADLSDDEIKKSVGEALDIWGVYALIKFQLASCKNVPEPDIKILFAVGNHGENCNPFDGSDNVLAHAFYPANWALGGDVHLDDAETWSVDPDEKYDLVTVAAHELGHSLGLQHSPIKEALMYAFYGGGHRYLDPDDIDGIQALYPSPLPSPCIDGDKDGYGVIVSQACSKSSIDCNDSDATIHPGAKEICDKKDNDCDYDIDEDQNFWKKNCGTCADSDNDGYGKSGTNTIACLYNVKDCNDNDADVHPGAIEFCDKLDNNCNGVTDEDPSFYNNCGKCGPDETSVGELCGSCGVIKCKPGGGVMCEEPCPAGQSCCGDGCMPDGGDCCTKKGLWEGFCPSDSQCVSGGECVANPISCGNGFCDATKEICANTTGCTLGYFACCSKDKPKAFVVIPGLYCCPASTFALPCQAPPPVPLSAGCVLVEAPQN